MLSRPGGALLAGLLAGLVVSDPAGAEVYRFEDEAGVVHFTNAPSDGRYQLLPGTGPPVPPPQPSVVRRLVTTLAELIRGAAERYGLDHRLVEAVVRVESGGNARAVSPKGAMGLMQLMPQTAQELGVRNPFDLQENLDGGTRHLRSLLDRFEGDVTLALAAYNAGEEAVRTYRGVPPFRETQDYVRKIRTLWNGTVLRPAALPARPTREVVYQTVGDDGGIVFTNLPPPPQVGPRAGL